MPYRESQFEQNIARAEKLEDSFDAAYEDGRIDPHEARKLRLLLRHNTIGQDRADRMIRLVTSYLRADEDVVKNRFSEVSRRTRDMKKNGIPVLPRLEVEQDGPEAA